MDRQLIQRIPLFAGLKEEVAERLLETGEVRSHRRPRLLFREGDPPDRLFVLLEGTVELFASGSGREGVILIVWPPEVLLPAAALTDEPYLMSARTLGPARLLAVEAGSVRSLVRRSTLLSNRFSAVLAGQFRMTVRHIKELKLRSGPCRLGAFLIRLVDATGAQGCADLPIPKGVLASRLGVTPATLSRAFLTLRAHGVTVRGRRVVITDRTKLERFCGADPLMDGRELRLSATAI